MKRQLGAWWNSSADAEKLATSIKGFLGVGVMGAIIAVLKILGADINLNDLNELLDSILGIIVLVPTVVSAFVGLYGLIRRMFFKVGGLGAYKK